MNGHMVHNERCCVLLRLEKLFSVIFEINFNYFNCFFLFNFVFCLEKKSKKIYMIQINLFECVKNCVF